MFLIHTPISKQLPSFLLCHELLSVSLWNPLCVMKGSMWVWPLVALQYWTVLNWPSWYNVGHWCGSAEVGICWLQQSELLFQFLLPWVDIGFCLPGTSGIDDDWFRKKEFDIIGKGFSHSTQLTNVCYLVQCHSLNRDSIVWLKVGYALIYSRADKKATQKGNKNDIEEWLRQK